MKFSTKINCPKESQTVCRFAAVLLRSVILLLICSNFLYPQELTPPNLLLQPLKNFIPQRKTETKIEEPVCDLPNFGEVRSVPQQTTFPNQIENGQAESLSFGSLEFSRRLVPAIYADGEGYVPATHPAFAPYLNQNLDKPGVNPNIVMVPEHQLAGYEGDESIAAVFGWSGETRIVNAAAPTLLSLPKQENTEPLVISAKTGWYKQTKDYNIYFLTGDCCVRQGKNSVAAPQTVVWLARKKSSDKNGTMFEAAVYAEGSTSAEPVQVEIDPDQVAARISDTKWFGRFYTRTAAQVVILEPQEAQEIEPAIYHRGLAVMSPESSVIQQVQFLEEKKLPLSSSAPQFRRITLNNRSDKEANMRFDPYPDNPERGIVVISKGINLVIEGVTGQDMLLGDVVDISADHAVIWSANPAKLQHGGSKEDAGQDFEVYLEGNIIFRDQQRTIEASRMYYDAKNKIAYVLDSELTTPILGIKGITGAMRMKAEILQQLGDGMFSAKNSYVTTSMLGEPTYSLHSRKITLQERIGGTTCFGKDDDEMRQILTAENNYIAAGRLPVFYWPWLAADLKDPTFYIKNIAYGHSTYFGNEIKTSWNPFQLFNVRRPNWLNGSVNVSWFELRGIIHAADFSYNPRSFCSIPVPASGKISYWGLYDNGESDYLGGRRRSVPFPNEYRYRFGWQHSQMFDSFCNCKGPWQLSAQVSKVSDRNLINAYFPGYWKTYDNETTAVSLKRFDDNSSLAVSAEYSLDKFYTNSNSIPRLDHYVIGKSLLNDYLTWYGHTRVGYADVNTAESPYTPDYAAWAQDSQYFWYLPWELQNGSPTSRPVIPDWNNPTNVPPETINSSFEFFSTRHEVDLPFNIGPVRTVPYALGEFSHWGKDRSGEDVQRLYGQVGVRFDLPFWKVIPGCSSRTWYVNGLAHKVNFDTEFAYTQSNRSMDDLILTDSLDSWSVEDFRRRYPFYTFTARNNTFALPALFDPRYYALRSGTAGNVTAQNMEIADDMMFLRTGMTHRFQTKRGPVGKRRIIDWITLGVHFTFFPQEKFNSYTDPNPTPTRDFSSSKNIGLLDYDFLWHVGDRFSLYSNGFYDHQQKMTTAGMMWQRPKRGNFSASVTDFRGIIEQTLLNLSAGYDMNEKYSIFYSTSYDMKNQWENLGHNLLFVRTGESFRIFVGAVYNTYRKEWSFSFGLEPVFMRGIAQKMNRMSMESQQQSTAR